MRTPIMSSDFPPPPMSPNTTYFIGCILNNMFNKIVAKEYYQKCDRI